MLPYESSPIAPSRPELRLTTPAPREVTRRIKRTIPGYTERDEWGEWDVPEQTEWCVQTVWEHGAPQWCWVDQRTGRVLQVANLERVQRAPRLPEHPLPDGNRYQRRYKMPDLSQITSRNLRKITASPAFVPGQVATNSGTSVTTLSVSLPSNVTAGNAIILAIASNDPGSNVNTPTDTLGNTYAVGIRSINTSNAQAAFWFTNDVPAGACTVTVTCTSRTMTIAVLEYTGVGLVAGNRSFVDQAVTSQVNANTASLSPVPNQAGGILLSVISDNTGGQTWTAGGALTNRRVSVTTTRDLALGDGLLSTTSVAPPAATWSSGGSATQIASCAIVLRPPGTLAATKLVASSFASASSWTTGSFFPKAGALLIAQVVTGSGSVTTTSVSDSGGGSWSPLLSKTNASGCDLSTWMSYSTASSLTTFTATATGGSAVAEIVVYEMAGIVRRASIIDQTATATGNGTAISVGATGTTTVANEVALLFTGISGTIGITPGGGATIHGNFSGTGVSAHLCSLVLNTTGTQTMTATADSGAQWAGVLVTVVLGGITFVQAITAGNLSASTNPLGPFSWNVAVGNLLVFSSSASGGKTLSSITADSKGTWTKCSAGTNGNEEVALCYAPNHGAGKLGATITFSGTTAFRAVVAEYAGMDAAPLDLVANTSGTSQTAASGTTATPNYLSELVIAAAGDTSTGLTYLPVTPGAAPFLSPTTIINLGMAHTAVLVAGAAPTPQSSTFAISGGSNVAWAGAVATFKVANSPAYYNRRLSESAAAAEAFSRTVQYPRAIAEPANAAEVVARTFNAARGIAEAVAAAENPGRHLAAQRALAEIAHAAEAFNYGLVTFQQYRLSIQMALVTLLEIGGVTAKTLLQISEPRPTTSLVITLGKPEDPMSASYLPMAGNKMVLTFDFTDVDTGDSTQPASFTAYAELADGTPIVTYNYGTDSQVTRPDPVGAPGRFEVVFDTTNFAGEWVVEGRCPSGQGQAVEEKRIYVRPRTAS